MMKNNEIELNHKTRDQLLEFFFSIFQKSSFFKLFCLQKKIMVPKKIQNVIFATVKNTIAKSSA